MRTAVMALSIALIVLGAVGLIISIVGRSVIGAKVPAVEPMLGNVADTLEKASKTGDETLKKAVSSLDTASATISNTSEYLGQTGKSILEIKERLALKDTKDTVTGVRGYLETPETRKALTSTTEAIKTTRGYVAKTGKSLKASEFILTSEEISKLNEYLAPGKEVSAGELLDKAEELTGYIIAIPAVKSMVEEMDKAKVKFKVADGSFLISGEDIVKTAVIIERRTGFDMTSLRRYGVYLKAAGMAAEIPLAPTLEVVESYLSYAEGQKILAEEQMLRIVEGLGGVEGALSLVEKQLPSVVMSLKGAEAGLIFADEKTGEAAEFFSTTSKSLDSLSDQLKATNESLRAIKLSDSLKPITADLRATKVDPLISTLLNLSLVFVLIGSILFIVAGVGLLLVNRRIGT